MIQNSRRVNRAGACRSHAARAGRCSGLRKLARQIHDFGYQHLPVDDAVPFDHEYDSELQVEVEVTVTKVVSLQLVVTADAAEVVAPDVVSSQLVVLAGEAADVVAPEVVSLHEVVVEVVVVDSSVHVVSGGVVVVLLPEGYGEVAVVAPEVVPEPLVSETDDELV
jgi:hypothetical protein